MFSSKFTFLVLVTLVYDQILIIYVYFHLCMLVRALGVMGQAKFEISWMAIVMRRKDLLLMIEFALVLILDFLETLLLILIWLHYIVIVVENCYGGLWSTKLIEMWKFEKELVWRWWWMKLANYSHLQSIIKVFLKFVVSQNFILLFFINVLIGEF